MGAPRVVAVSSDAGGQLRPQSRAEVKGAADPGLDCSCGGPPTYRYAVVSLPRTGSTWLCSSLANLGSFGVPLEYLNPGSLWTNVERLFGAPDACGPRDAFRLTEFIDRFEKIRTTPNGCFGIKIQPEQLMTLVRGDLKAGAAFLSRFDALVVLARRDRLGQAVSAAIAESTDKWFDDGTEPDLSKVPMRRLLHLTGVRMGRQFVSEGHLSHLVRHAGRPVLNLIYENLVTDMPGTLDRVAAFLGQPDAARREMTNEMLRMPERPPGRVAAAVRARFIDFIEGRDAAVR